jgi:hypothetical protein
MRRQGIVADEQYEIVLNEYFDKSVSKDAKIVLRWILGLTNKQIQNVMRSKESELHAYVTDLKKNHFLVIGIDYDDWARGDFQFSESQLKTLDELQLFTTIGAQSLAIRGSEKSLYGKFFEKMILGSVLSVMGFQFSEKPTTKPGSFWLSSTDKRESDATVLWDSKHAVRLDIGFIGAGNTEITLDKVSRFSKKIEISGKEFHVTTVIIADRVGEKSSIFDLAKDINGHIVQMSDGNWVKKLGTVFEKTFKDFDFPFKGDDQDTFEKLISIGVQKAPLEKIFNVAVSTTQDSDVEEGKEQD